MADYKNTGSFRDLYRIVDDLWSHSASTSDDHRKYQLPFSMPVIEPLPPETPLEIPDIFTQLPDGSLAFKDMPGNEPVAPAVPVEQKPEAPVPEVPKMDKLWAVCDSQIDWTAALAGEKPENDLSKENWDFCCEIAPRVLDGDISAYKEVLERIAPLDDLKTFCTRMDASVENADRLYASFAVSDEAAGDDPEHAVCGLALRVARDLFAALPVTEAAVEGMANGTSVQVTFSRSQLHRARFAFIDPVAFVKECQG